MEDVYYLVLEEISLLFDRLATVSTDLDDYSPGSTALISGSNFQPGETVELQVLHTDGTPNTGGGHEPWFVTDGSSGDLDGLANGKFETTWYVNPDDSAGSAFELIATGLNSHQIATVNFTDAGNPTPVQTFYVPLPEADINTALGNLYSGVGSTINSVISITVTSDNSYIYYDHWEDGYETDISNPAQSSTEIWGDGDLTNGTAPGTTDDLLDEGDIVALENEVSLPRDSSVTLYDGRDKIASSKAIAITRAAWATSPGSVLAGAVEVYDTNKYGTSFEVPVGENIDSNSIFQYTSLLVTAAQDGTEITVDKKDGGGTITRILNEGETYLVNGGVNAGATLTATNPVQAQLLTGDVGAFYESRWFTLYPTEQWSNSYYSPVGTTVSSDPAKVFVYNPNAAQITVNYETLNGMGTFPVDPGDVYPFEMPANSGAHFYTASDTEKFFAIGAIDADISANATHDWGFSLVPESNLTPAAVIGWGPGSSTLTKNGSPAWVTAVDATRIYVDYDGDSTTGDFTDPNGDRYDEHYDISKLESRQFFDNVNNDNNQTGMRIYTTDGTNLTAAWGQDPANASPGNPYLDLGTTVLPLPVSSVKKEATLAVNGDVNNNGLSDPGDTIEYKITVTNDGVVVLGNVVVNDTIPSGIQYVENSTKINDTSVNDDTLGTTNFLFDEGGYNIGNVAVGDSATVSFQMQINDPYDGPVTGITNSAQIDSDRESFSVTVTTAIANDPSTTEFTDAAGTPVALYAENEQIYVKVTDPDPNLDSNAQEQIEVTITNTTTGDRETITLTETGNDTGIFTSSISSSTSSGQSVDDGTLYAVAGNNLEVSYSDLAFSADTSSDTISVSVPSASKILYLSDTSDLDRIDPTATPVDSSDSTSVELTTNVGGTPSELFISEYIEGSGFNKAIEIFNGTGSAIDLSVGNYSLELYSNGSATASQTLNLTGTVAAGDVYILANDGTTSNPADTAITSVADVISDSVINFNGDDAVVLKKGTAIVDAIGKVGEAPTSGEWGTGNTSTKDNTLRRQSSVIAGDTVTNDAFNPSLEWDGYAQDTFDGLGSHSIAGGSTSTTFTQAIPFTSDFVMPAGGIVTVTTYVNVTSGTMPTNPNVTAVLKEGGVTFATLTNAAYSSSNGTITWTGTLDNAATATTGEAIELEISTNESAADFEIKYDSHTYPSKIELPTNTVIDITSLGVYDAPFIDDGNSTNDGNLIDASFNGDTVYVRAVVEDPFGDYDITELTVNINDPSGNPVSITPSEVKVVDAAVDGQKIYEYQWQTSAISGDYQISATAQEGLEATPITDTSGTIFNLSALDLGTPSVTEFVDVNGDAVINYIPGSTIYLQITDTDENIDSGIKETITATITTSTGDTETVTLTETGFDTGIFQILAPIVGIPSDPTLGTGANDGTLNAPEGTILSASYEDPDNPNDTSGDTASVLASPSETNELPVATNDTNSTPENQILNVSAADGVINLISNPDSDPDLDSLTVVSVDGTSVATGGTTINLTSGAQVTMNPDGSYDYNPNSQFDYLGANQTATDSFTYTISDGNGGTDTATVTITINGVNENPTAGNDSFTTIQGEAINLSASAVTTNDSDPNGDALTIDSVTPATTSNGGTVVLNTDGTITYTPNASFVGVDTFDYTIIDGKGGTATATISITVEAPPVINLDPNNDSSNPNPGNFETTYSYSPVNVTNIDAGELTSSVADADATAPNYSFLNLTITGVRNGASEVLNIGGTDFNLGTNTTGQVTVGSTTFDVTVSNDGSSIRLVNSSIVNNVRENIPEADLETLIQGITYSNNATVPTSGDRTIDFTISDGNNSSNMVTSTITPLFTNGTDSSEVLSGTTESERISGYKGQDTLSGGGGGDDYYYFNETSDGVDIITDFDIGGGDILVFSDIIANETDYTYTGSDPITEGYVVLTHYASVGTMVQVDFDGSTGTSTLLKDVVFIDDTANTTSTSNVTVSDFVFQPKPCSNCS